MHYIPSLGGLAIAILVLGNIIFFGVGKKNAFSLIFGIAFEGMNKFFADILEKAEDAWMTSYITSMFFVIWLYNILGLLTDYIAPIFGYNQTKGAYFLAEYIGFATSDYHFNIAMAGIGLLIMLGVQFVTISDTTILGKTFRTNKTAGWFIRMFNIIYEYVPFWGKKIISIEKGSMHTLLYYPLRALLKICDIIISLFIGFLDIIGLFAKVVSLSFRLYGNMLAGTALLTVLIGGLGSSTLQYLGFEFPILGPIILFIQGLLVACIQAFVFPLLIAIFIKVAHMGSEEQPA